MTERSCRDHTPEKDVFRRAGLLRMIERLGAPGREATEAGRRVLPPGLSGILDAIDETVLPRRLVFRNRREEEMTLEIRSRRVFWAAGGQRDGAEGLPVSGLVLSHATPEELSALAHALQRFGTADALSVESEHSLYEAALDDAGLPVSALYRLSEEDCAPLATDRASTHVPSLEEFAETCVPLCQALLLRGPGGELREFGTASMLANLAAALENFCPFQPDSVDELPLGATLSCPGTPGGSLAVFSDGKNELAVQLAPDQEAALQSAWADWLARQSGP